MTMKRLLPFSMLFFILAFSTNIHAAKSRYGCYALTGGTTGALDALDITGASAPNAISLADGDSAIVVIISGTTSTVYEYVFDIDGTTAESSPSVIRPDDFATAGVWRLATVNTSALTVGQSIDITPSGVGSDDIVSIVPSTALTTNEAVWRGLYVNGDALDPSANDAKILGAYIDLSTVVPSGSGLYMEGYEIKMPSIFYNAVCVEEGRIRMRPSVSSQGITTHVMMDATPIMGAQDATSRTAALAVTPAVSGFSGDLFAVLAGIGVDPVHQDLTTLTSVDMAEYGARYTSGDTVWTDDIDDVEIFVADNDSILIGSAAVFDSIEIDMSTVATRSIVPTFWFYDTSPAWIRFYPQDDTDGFRRDGFISFNAADLTNWKSNHDPGGANGSAGYFIKITRTVNADPGTPTADTIKTGVNTEYGWDKTGSIEALNLVATGTILGGINVVVTTDGTEEPTAAQMYGTMFIADHGTAANDTDYTLPSAVAGMSACFYDNGAGEGGIIIDAAAEDEILLNGTGITVADAIDSPGVAGAGANGDYICILAIDATYWITLARSGTWVDGGAD